MDIERPKLKDLKCMFDNPKTQVREYWKGMKLIKIVSRTFCFNRLTFAIKGALNLYDHKKMNYPFIPGNCIGDKRAIGKDYK